MSWARIFRLSIITRGPGQSKSPLVTKLQTAASLGITIPPLILVQVDEVIE
jgi:hypothetical protein